MNNREITRVMKSNARVAKVFIGVYAADMLPPAGPPHRKPCAYIANTHKHNQPGEHWVGLYFPSSETPEFFDSYGRPPQSEFRTFLGDAYFYSNKFVQHPLTSVCAQYCCFFILKKTQGCTMEEILSYFTDDHVENDVLVNAMVEEHFCVDLNVIDVPYINNQISRSLRTK